MSAARIERMRRAYILDVVLGAALALLVGIEGVSLVSTTHNAASPAAVERGNAGPDLAARGVRLLDPARVVERDLGDDCSRAL
jgi:hypothetical protein